MILVLVETDAGGRDRGVARGARPSPATCGLATSHALVVGDGPAGAVVDQLAAYGVRTVHHADGDGVHGLRGRRLGRGRAWPRAGDGSVVVTAAGTPRGNEVLAHVAARPGVAMAANVVVVRAASPLSVVTRQVVGGAALEEMRLDDAAGGVHASPATPCDAAPRPSRPPRRSYTRWTWRCRRRPARPRGLAPSPGSPTCPAA